MELEVFPEVIMISSDGEEESENIEDADIVFMGKTYRRFHEDNAETDTLANYSSVGSSASEAQRPDLLTPPSTTDSHFSDQQLQKGRLEAHREPITRLTQVSLEQVTSKSLKPHVVAECKDTNICSDKTSERPKPHTIAGCKDKQKCPEVTSTLQKPHRTAECRDIHVVPDAVFEKLKPHAVTGCKETEILSDMTSEKLTPRTITGCEDTEIWSGVTSQKQKPQVTRRPKDTQICPQNPKSHIMARCEDTQTCSNMTWKKPKSHKTARCKDTQICSHFTSENLKPHTVAGNNDTRAWPNVTNTQVPYNLPRLLDMTQGGLRLYQTVERRPPQLWTLQAPNNLKPCGTTEEHFQRVCPNVVLDTTNSLISTERRHSQIWPGRIPDKLNPPIDMGRECPQNVEGVQDMLRPHYATGRKLTQIRMEGVQDMTKAQVATEKVHQQICTEGVQDRLNAHFIKDKERQQICTEWVQHRLNAHFTTEKERQQIRTEWVQDRLNAHFTTEIERQQIRTEWVQDRLNAHFTTDKGRQQIRTEGAQNMLSPCCATETERPSIWSQVHSADKSLHNAACGQARPNVENSRRFHASPQLLTNQRNASKQSEGSRRDHVLPKTCRQRKHLDNTKPGAKRKRPWHEGKSNTCVGTRDPCSTPQQFGETVLARSGQQQLGCDAEGVQRAFILPEPTAKQRVHTAACSHGLTHRDRVRLSGGMSSDLFRQERRDLGYSNVRGSGPHICMDESLHRNVARRNGSSETAFYKSPDSSVYVCPRTDGPVCTNMVWSPDTPLSNVVKFGVGSADLFGTLHPRYHDATRKGGVCQLTGTLSSLNQRHPEDGGSDGGGDADMFRSLDLRLYDDARKVEFGSTCMCGSLDPWVYDDARKVEFGSTGRTESLDPRLCNDARNAELGSTRSGSLDPRLYADARSEAGSANDMSTPLVPRPCSEPRNENAGTAGSSGSLRLCDAGRTGGTGSTGASRSPDPLRLTVIKYSGNSCCTQINDREMMRNSYMSQYNGSNQAPVETASNQPMEPNADESCVGGKGPAAAGRQLQTFTPHARWVDEGVIKDLNYGIPSSSRGRTDEEDLNEDTESATSEEGSNHDVSDQTDPATQAETVVVLAQPIYIPDRPGEEDGVKKTEPLPAERSKSPSAMARIRQQLTSTRGSPGLGNKHESGSLQADGRPKNILNKQPAVKNENIVPNNSLLSSQRNGEHHEAVVRIEHLKPKSTTASYQRPTATQQAGHKEARLEYMPMHFHSEKEGRVPEREAAVSLPRECVSHFEVSRHENVQEANPITDAQDVLTSYGADSLPTPSLGPFHSAAAGNGADSYNSIRPYQCGVCLMKFKQVQYLACHLMTGIHRKSYVSNRYKVYQSDSGVAEDVIFAHMQRSYKRPYQCALCFKDYDASIHLAIHFEREHSKGKTLFKCSLCCEYFLDARSLQRHAKIRHKITVPFKCQRCSHVVLKENEFFSHMMQAHSMRYSQCKYCRQYFWDESDFERHMAAHKPFCCNLCSQSFKNARLLWVHKESGHSTQCHLCSQTFENVSALWKHRESHVSHCDSDCTSCKQYERDWKLHAKLSNVAGSQFPCTTCGDVF